MNTKKNLGIDNPEFQENYQAFSNAVLAIYQADYLGERILSFPELDINEVLRERKLASGTAKHFFERMQEIGIPERLLSCHLQE